LKEPQEEHMWGRYAIVAFFTLQFILPGSSESQRADTPPRKGDISAPVGYKDLMLVITTADGACAVVFGNRIEMGVTYKYRFESKDGKTLSTGERKVLDRENAKGEHDGGELFIKAGQITLGWSDGDDGRGWIYYNPQNMRVHLAHAQDFDDRIEPDSGKRIDKLDLNRFVVDRK